MKNCHLYQIGVVKDHIHIVTCLDPSIALLDLVKDIKIASNDFIKKEKLFLNFKGWQNGHGAFTFTMKERDRLIEYVKNQEVQHS
jgi:REP element-mobilizing transposase RayT